MRRYRPSAADTWMSCPGQPSLVESIGVGPTDSVFAAEGRAAHALAKTCLDTQTDAVDHLGEELVERDEVDGTSHVFTVDEVFAGHVDTYLTAVRRAAYGAELLLVEQKVDLSRIMQVPNQSGTADAVIVHGNRLEVHDLKFGQGVIVEAKRNRQMLLYAAGVWLKHRKLGDIKKIQMNIHQPRAGHFDRSTVSVEGLKKFIALVRKKIRIAEDSKPGDNLNPGDSQCFWCPVKAQCPALQKKIEEEILADFDDLGELQLPEQAEGEAELAILGAKRSMVELAQQWIKAVTSLTATKLEQGHHIPGWRLAAGRKGNRQWVDQDATTETLKNEMRMRDADIFDKKLRTPAQLEKVLSPKRYQRLVEEGHVTQADGRPSVVPESSSRPAVAATVDFDDLDD